jgi:hypothetical protein
LKINKPPDGWLFYWEKEMPRQIKDMTREEIILAVKECAEKLGRAPTYKELTKLTPVTLRWMRRHFGTFSRLLQESKLDSLGNGKKIGLEVLLRDWGRVTREMKKLPNAGEYRHYGSYSDTPFRMRFGPWPRLPKAFQQYAEAKGWAEEWKDVLELIKEHEKEENGAQGVFILPKLTPEEPKATLMSPVLLDKPMYGAPVRQYPLAHYPINEIGVIFLFGALASEMGYMVTRLQSEFPDCEAMRQVEPGKWQRVRVEFEYESRNFLRHAHAAEECDLIVCWRHNWDECPLEVVELRKLLR